MGTFRFKSDLRNHQAIVQPRLYDSLVVTQMTLGEASSEIYIAALNQTGLRGLAGPYR